MSEESDYFNVELLRKAKPIFFHLGSHDEKIQKLEKAKTPLDDLNRMVDALREGKDD